MGVKLEERKSVVHGNGEKAGETNDSVGDALTVKITWTPTRRGRKYYYYPRVTIPSRIMEQLGIKPLEQVEFEVRVERRGEQQVIVLVPQRKFAYA